MPIKIWNLRLGNPSLNSLPEDLCSGLSRHEKIHRLQSGLNPRTLDLEASTLKIKPGTFSSAGNAVVTIQTAGTAFVFSLQIPATILGTLSTGLQDLSVVFFYYLIISNRYMTRPRQLFVSIMLIMLTRRKENDTYLATVSRRCWSSQITMKIDKL